MIRRGNDATVQFFSRQKDIARQRREWLAARAAWDRTLAAMRSEEKAARQQCWAVLGQNLRERNAAPDAPARDDW